MDFGEAIKALKTGKKVARAGWNGKGMWLQLCTPHEQVGYLTVIEGEGRWLPLSPHILMKTADHKFVPWLASQTDVLAEDWEVVE
uniref:DUF2829 domain-containing protein n=1 Tax=Paenibacillus sp. FSL L8-0436 TaxID=2954686 RepID=UPI00406C7A64